jgi:hypothetical protein
MINPEELLYVKLGVLLTIKGRFDIIETDYGILMHSIENEEGEEESIFGSVGFWFGSILYLLLSFIYIPYIMSPYVWDYFFVVYVSCFYIIYIYIYSLNGFLYYRYKNVLKTTYIPKHNKVLLDQTLKVLDSRLPYRT